MSEVTMHWDSIADVWATIPVEDQAELNRIIEAWEDDLDCMDNLRVARIGDTTQEAWYFDQQSHGCCGFMDIIHMCSSARQYRVGCNYGH